jgi:hypothetical protein
MASKPVKKKKEKAPITVAKVAGKAVRVPVKGDSMTVKDLLKKSEIKLERGEQPTRDGAVLKLSDRAKSGDIILIEQNDNNG